nr:YjbF family lipoprotein [Photobacterium frigidiphilum]
MLVTEGGRLVNSLNLPQGNLIETYSSQLDPLTLGLQRANTSCTGNVPLIGNLATILVTS